VDEGINEIGRALLACKFEGRVIVFQSARGLAHPKTLRAS